VFVSCPLNDLNEHTTGLFLVVGGIAKQIQRDFERLIVEMILADNGYLVDSVTLRLRNHES
jgi:hypothetical protein